MKFSVGYQFLEDDSFVDMVLKHKSWIQEVYFPWADIPNGRGTIGTAQGIAAFEYQNRMISDLCKIASTGIQMNLLINGNCYGKLSQSRTFYSKIGDTLSYLVDKVGLQSVTTTSPLVAKFIKANFEEIEVRASVNMEIGTTQGMDYITHYFDGYYLKREHNRDLDKIKENKKWCDEHDKKLYLLANSGCLNHCSVHNFHDNLVAHEAEIQSMDNAYDFKGVCHEYLSQKNNMISVLRDTNFIRPEDLHLYEPYFSVVKLATRSNRNPMQVIDAYVNKSHRGNLLELMEPDHSADIYPHIIDNTKIPDDFGQKRMNCGKDCQECTYCESAVQTSAVNVEEFAGGAVFGQ